MPDHLPDDVEREPAVPRDERQRSVASAEPRDQPSSSIPPHPEDREARDATAVARGRTNAERVLPKETSAEQQRRDASRLLAGQRIPHDPQGMVPQPDRPVLPDSGHDPSERGGSGDGHTEGSADPGGDSA